MEFQPTAREWSAAERAVEQNRRTRARPEEAESQRNETSAFLLEIVETLILTLVIFLLIRTVVQNFRIDGDSMEPNFHDGQYLIINKLAYRFGKPQRGDVIVFQFPRDPSRDFIKRVIGLPGETVEVRRGQVFIDGIPLEEPYAPNMGRYDAGPTVLGPNEIYVLGDNRDHSSDSHAWGPLALDFVIGKAVLIYWPYDSWGLIPQYASAESGR